MYLPSGDLVPLLDIEWQPFPQVFWEWLERAGSCHFGESDGVWSDANRLTSDAIFLKKAFSQDSGESQITPTYTKTYATQFTMTRDLWTG